MVTTVAVVELIQCCQRIYWSQDGVLVRATPVVKTLASLISTLPLVCHRLTTCGGEVRSGDAACCSHSPFVSCSL